MTPRKQSGSSRRCCSRRAGRFARGAALGHRRVGGGPHPGDGLSRLEDRRDDRPADLPDTRPGRALEPGRLVGGDPGSFVPRRADLDVARRLRVDRRHRGGPEALAPCALADRAGHRHCLADDDSGDGGDRRRRIPDLEMGGMTSKPHWFLPDTPDVLGMLRQQLAVTIHGWTRSSNGRRATRAPPIGCERSSTRRTSASVSCSSPPCARSRRRMTRRTSTRSAAASTGSSTSKDAVLSPR